jgi:hypothetical protein
MDCSGIDLVHPVDRMPPGSFPYLFNTRVISEGRIDGRPGYSVFGAGVGGPKLLHSIRRLNDPDESLVSSGYTYIVGNGTQLWEGQETALAEIDSGYSGNPLSLIPFRPNNSPESWMYVYDQDKQVKVRADGTLRAIGVTPPNAAPNIDFGIPASVAVETGNSAVGWTVSLPFVSITGGEDRTNGGAFTIANILYNSGTAGWACINPSAGVTNWTGARMNIVLNSGGGNQETVTIREIHTPIATSYVQAIQYDSGSTGLCSLVLNGLPGGLDRNSLIQIADGTHTDVIRVLSVVLSPDGTAYSVRCSTVHTFAAGAGSVVTGLLSWYCYTALAHATTETITSLFNFIAYSGSAAGTGTARIKFGSPVNCLNANGRTIDPANDYLHISLFLETPLTVATLTLLIDIDPATATGGTPFTGNFWQWNLTQKDLGSFGQNSAGVWGEIVIPISQGIQNGGNLALDFSAVQAVGITIVSTGVCNWGFDWWYFFGTYGPVIQPNAPSGYFYDSVFRDSSTGALSVPGPTTRYSLDPLRESIVATPATTTAGGVDYSDIYREGGTLTEFVYVGSVQNNNASPNSFTDGLADETIATNPSPDLTQLQPWPTLGLAWTGVVNVVGTSVIWVSGTTFNVNLLQNSIILLNGVAYLTRGQPHSPAYLEIQSDAGVLTNAAYSIESPTLANQPLPIVFGPLEGPFAPVAFGLGDLVNAGTLYFTNTANLDGVSDQNTIELSGPSEPLVTGEVWNGLVFAGSRLNTFLVRYSFIQALEGQSPYQFVRLPSPSGFWCKWGICRGPDGAYAIGRDGIYRWTDQGGGKCHRSKTLPAVSSRRTTRSGDERPLSGGHDADFVYAVVVS